MHRRIEKGIETLIKASGYFTSLTVLLIVLFLFREGISFLGSEPIEEGYALYVSRDNPVKQLSATDIKNIFDQKIHLWSALGGSADTIRRFELADLQSLFDENALGKSFEHSSVCIRRLMDSIPSAIVVIPQAAMESEEGLQRIHTEKIDLADFLGGKEWFPTAKPAGLFGSLPLFMGTLLVSFFAILIALPFGMAGAIYLAEIADKRIRNILKPTIELLSGIPSVVYGFFGLVVIVPWIQQTLGLPVGESALAGSVVLAIMALPTIITVSEDAIRTIPSDVRQASLALGASQWQTIVRVLIPYAASGIGAAVILGIGRAMGETMAVLMVTGNAAIMPSGLTHPVRTIPATIAAELGEAAYGGLHFKALFALGCILFLITFITNYIVDSISRKRKLK